LPLNSKKIEEDYTMFDEQIDNEPELQEIIEEAFEEEDSVSDEGANGGALVASVRDERAL